MTMRGLAFCAFLLAWPAFAQDPPPKASPPGPARASEAPAPDPGDAAEEEAGEGAPEKILRPPGGCEGRNPLYCEEEEPDAPEEASDEEEPERRQLRNPKNPSRNPHRRPPPSAP